MMTKLFKIVLLLVLPASLFAQDTAAVKRQASVIAKALMNSDFKTVIAHTYPKAVEIGGGKEKLLQMMTTGIGQMKAQGFAFEKVTIGSPGKFYKAGTEIHCLLPETIIMKTGKGRIAAKSNLLAVSKDKGKSWTFLDLNQQTISYIKTIFPNFNNSLIIPRPTPPVTL
ncbi:hypothetical protein [Mucilaginibacter phyllosphaerae]|uniref:Nuclear transport factor 2 family protein n=1 Tax=Mucilaginibacter phyllosphaerae TaxID=1812349 RepID=A0A4Y8AKL7_9SPHI|nr:hypothetical protein [Mucilaginibacter phyllosphaerae]MBB3967911.1 hypothetical protein [Mucilaginibacter phyllosphaerae]TEW69049.1 hypothetical protein E2R65_02475 [Mucilaginibacter phyllosphaerae]GGH02465.1 hypothetical protein GCM10007352_04730 [Mucilaginibacter phyllosphaerae]